MSATPASLGRRLFAEVLGTALLVMAVVGSGIMAERLSSGWVSLLENVVATGAALFVLIAVLGPISGAQFNPVVTIADAWFGGLAKREVLPYVAAQIVGACLGAVLPNLMFGLAAVTISTHLREGSSILLSEVVATFGLLIVVFGLLRGGRSALIPSAVALYIVSASWFTASTSFANPAVTIGRMFSNTFAGIALSSVPGFLVAQIAGGALAIAVVMFLWPRPSHEQATVVDVVEESR